MALTLMQGQPNRGELQANTIDYIPYTCEKDMLNTLEVVLRHPKINFFDPCDLDIGPSSTKNSLLSRSYPDIYTLGI